MKRVKACEVTWSGGWLRRFVDRLWWGHSDHACIRWSPVDEPGEHTPHNCQCGARCVTPRHKQSRRQPHTPIPPRAAGHLIALGASRDETVGSAVGRIVLSTDGSKTTGPLVAATPDGRVTMIVDEVHDWSGVRPDDPKRDHMPAAFRRQWLDDAIWAHAEATEADLRRLGAGGRQGPMWGLERPAGARRAPKEQGSSKNPTIGEIAEAAGLDFDEAADMDPRTPRDIEHNHDGQGPFHPECFACNGPYAGWISASPTLRDQIIGRDKRGFQPQHTPLKLDPAGCDVNHDIHQEHTLAWWYEHGEPPTCQHFPSYGDELRAAIESVQKS